MKDVEALLEAIAKLFWPVVALIIVWWFRDEIKALIVRIRSAKLAGVELTAAPVEAAQQKREDEVALASVENAVADAPQPAERALSAFEAREFEDRAIDIIVRTGVFDPGSVRRELSLQVEGRTFILDAIARRKRTTVLIEVKYPRRRVSKAYLERALLEMTRYTDAYRVYQHDEFAQYAGPLVSSRIMDQHPVIGAFVFPSDAEGIPDEISGYGVLKIDPHTSRPTNLEEFETWLVRAVRSL